jgi:hypothetical protein
MKKQPRAHDFKTASERIELLYLLVKAACIIYKPMEKYSDGDFVDKEANGPVLKAIMLNLESIMNCIEQNFENIKPAGYSLFTSPDCIPLLSQAVWLFPHMTPKLIKYAVIVGDFLWKNRDALLKDENAKPGFVKFDKQI